MRTTGFGLIVMAGVLAVVIGVSTPASAHPGSHGRGGEQTNRYDARGCQQGGHEARVEAETGRVFTNAGDCTSHTALGGTVTAATGQIYLNDSATYGCPTMGDQCWGTLSVSGAPAGRAIEVVTTDGIVVTSRAVVGADGSFNGNADIPCAFTEPTPVQAVVVNTIVKSGFVVTGSC